MVYLKFSQCKPLSPKWFIWFFLKLFLFNFGSIVFKFSQFCLEYFFKPTASAQKNNYWVSCAMQLFPKLFTIFGKPNCLLAVECNKFAILIESFRWVSESFATYIWSEILHETFTTPLKVWCKPATNLRRTFIKIVFLYTPKNQPKCIKNKSRILRNTIEKQKHINMIHEIMRCKQHTGSEAQCLRQQRM